MVCERRSCTTTVVSSASLSQDLTSSGYVTDECIGTVGCFPSPTLCGSRLNKTGQGNGQCCERIKPQDNIGEGSITAHRGEYALDKVFVLDTKQETFTSNTSGKSTHTFEER
jgi:hypothetical protein